MVYKESMKLNWFGKLLMANAAYNVTKNIMKEDPKSQLDVTEESRFSKVEIKCMKEAIAQEDFETFRQIYEDRKPDDGIERIKEFYEWMREENYK